VGRTHTRHLLLLLGSIAGCSPAEGGRCDADRHEYWCTDDLVLLECTDGRWVGLGADGPCFCLQEARTVGPANERAAGLPSSQVAGTFAFIRVVLLNVRVTLMIVHIDRTYATDVPRREQEYTRSYNLRGQRDRAAPALGASP
jgi:hypothetical protein